MAADQDLWQQSAPNLTCEMICHCGSEKPRATLCSTEPLNTTSLQFLRIIATSLQAAYEIRLVACSATLYTYAFLMRVFSPFFTALLPICVCVCVCVCVSFLHIETCFYTHKLRRQEMYLHFFSAMKVTGACSNFCKGYIKKQDKQKWAGFTEK